jgi:ketosteroid isomerase-like protein
VTARQSRSERPRPATEAETRLIRSSYAAFNRRDLDTLLELYHPECSWDLSRVTGWPDRGVYRGHEGLRAMFEDWFEAWEEFAAEVSEVQRAGRRYFIRASFRVRGRESGVPMEFEWAQIGEAREGRISTVVNYSDIDEAERALWR